MLLKNLILKNVSILVEVYDNSHIQEQIVLVQWLHLVMKVLLKKDIENLILKQKELNKMILQCLKEVLSRRFKRAMLEKGNYLNLPDLILIDGGKGQYSSAKEVLDELGLHDLPMIAIAKGKMRNSGDETFFYNGKVLNLKKMIHTIFYAKT